MKKCGVCGQEIKTDDIVVALLLAKFKIKDSKSYDLEVMSQTIASHVYCVEKPQSDVVVTPAEVKS